MGAAIASSAILKTVFLFLLLNECEVDMQKGEGGRVKYGEFDYSPHSRNRQERNQKRTS